jgi:hypothetical protein
MQINIMDELKGFYQFNEEVYKKQRENNIEDLYQLSIEGQGAAAFMSDVLYKKHNIHPYPYSVFKLHDELYFITKDIKYVIGVIYLLRPHIVDAEATDGIYYQNVEDQRYLQHVNFGYQAVYNFWDRLGDILHLFFHTGLAMDQVYFNRVLNNMPQQYKTIKEYEALKALYDKVGKVLELRHEAVHHFQIEAKHYWGNIEFTSKPLDRNRLNTEKFEYPEKLKTALSISLNAFVATIRLINVLPDKSA